MIRVAALTPGRDVPSARFRVRQLVPFLRGEGIELNEFFPALGAFPPGNRLLRPLWGMGSVGERIPAVLLTHRHDLTLIQREMVSSHLTLEPFTKSPRIFDVDDAIWLRRGGGFARRLAEISDRVVCGNRFLAEEFSRWNKEVTVIPTAVDLERFVPAARGREKERVIGWSGSSGGFPYLYAIEPAIATVLKEIPAARLRIVADRKPEFRLLDSDRWEFVPWSPAREAGALQDLAVGIMPLDDSPFARGKCAFKMLCYMSCEVPVVVSPVGVNADILRQADVGYGAVTHDDWVDSLTLLLKDPEKAVRQGARGRALCRERYSIEVITPELASVIRETV